MINQELLRRVLKDNLFPWDSKIIFTLNMKSIVSTHEKSAVFDSRTVKLIKGLCIGSTVKNPIEDLDDISSDEDIKNKLLENTEVEYQQLDGNSDVAVFKLELQILYANRSSLTEEICEKLESLYVKTPFGGFKI